MNVEIKDAGDARKIVNVTFDSDEMSSKGKEVCREFSRMANIPGFRKGKAPEQVIRKRFAKEIQQELTRKVSTSAYEAVLAEKDIKVYSILKVEPGDVSSESSASIEVTVDIISDFELPKYEEFELTVHPTDVSDEDVQKEAYRSAELICEGAPKVARWHKEFARNILKKGKVTEKINNLGYKCYDTEDFKIGYQSFLNKIKPKFKNK